MSKFIVVNCIEIRQDDVEIIQPFVINVNHIVLIEQEWWECNLECGVRKDGHLRTKVYMTKHNGYRYLVVRETVSEIMSMIGSDCVATAPSAEGNLFHLKTSSLESLSESTKQFVDSNRLADDKRWDKYWRNVYGDGRGGEE